VTAAPKPDSEAPDWKQLRVFVVMFSVSLAGLFLLAWLCLGDRPNFFIGLPHLGAAWSCQDSWASNVTVAGGLLTCILGSSDLLKEVLGEDAEFSLGVATVGAAIAVAIAGAGALVALASRRKSDDGTQDLFSPYGLLIAGALTLAAAGGELWVVWKSGEKPNRRGHEPRKRGPREHLAGLGPLPAGPRHVLRSLHPPGPTQPSRQRAGLPGFPVSAADRRLTAHLGCRRPQDRTNPVTLGVCLRVSPGHVLSDRPRSARHGTTNGTMAQVTLGPAEC